MKYQKLYGKKKLHLNDVGKSLLANNFNKCSINMLLKIRSDSDMSLSYQRNEKIQNRVPTSFSNAHKIMDSELKRDCPSNPMIGCFK